MKRRLMRPTAALFPLSGLMAALIVPARRNEVALLFLTYYAVQLLSLCAADSFRNAAAQEPGVRRVDRRFWGALTMLLIGILLSITLSFLLNMGMLAVGAASLVCVEQLFEERIFAYGKNACGAILSGASNLLLLAGMLCGGALLPVAAGVGAVTAVVVSYVVEPNHGFSLAPANLGFAPRAGVQTLLYPLLVLAAQAILSMKGMFEPDFLMLAALFGLIPWRLARTTYRRTQSESKPLTLVLLGFALVAGVGAILWEELLPFAIMAVLAMVSGILTFCTLFTPGGE